jgi:hypothetical protein
MFDQNVDLGDFCELLDREIELVAKELGEGDGVDILRLVQQQCRVVNEQLKLTVILSGFSGGSYQYSNGVSVFFPWSREGYEVSRKNYESLWYSSDLERDEAPWTRFLTTYLNDVSLRKLEDVVEQTGAGSRFRYPSGVKFSEGTVTNLSGRSSQRTKIAGHEGTKIAGHEGTKIAGHEGTKIAGHEGTKIAGHEGTRSPVTKVPISPVTKALSWPEVAQARSSTAYSSSKISRADGTFLVLRRSLTKHSSPTTSLNAAHRFL